MSISGVGAYGSAGLDQILSRMLSRLDDTNSTTSTTDSTSTTTNAGSIAPAQQSTASTALTGTGQSALSDRIMALLVQLQQQSGADGTQGANATAPSATQSTAGDPIQQLFSAMDGDGDGSVSKTELESYVEGKGGTQAQADTLFSTLNQDAGGQNGSTGISEQQLAAGVSQAGHSGHHRHHHGGSDKGTQDANASPDVASQIFSALDTNKDGTVSADEFAAAFATSNSAGGTDTSVSGPGALFAQIDGNANGSVTQDELGNFLNSLAQQVQSDMSTMGAFAQLATQSYDASASLLNQANAGQSSYA